ncbi:winged helix-turn-helix domain-containing protein [Buttiauxella sp. A2-C1_F]|uniref:winged helix-turn-helix domain-containing protein n=1 Tax=Buttiauxella sp. A2-C1_F TaxID=2904526 RepID=UPI001E3511F2|nr:winged helix-turn-helix domain-containing protein [Buttiauxella sp. A2-C1_F]MCE0844163.1 winged helix-turn-helix domain-containing protein [Buttiauxella sp. A2-C1_F]
MAKVSLNGTIIFDEEKYTLSHCESESDVIILGATTSRCLGLFIANQGEVIYKKDLLHNGWGKFGTVVAEGSMWQVISQLRKAFEHFQLDGGLIITVPRIGYKLSSELTVERLSITEQAESLSAEIILRADDLPMIVENETPSSPDILSEKTAPTKKLHKRWLSQPLKIGLALVLLNLVLLCGFYLYQRLPASLPMLAQRWHFSQEFNNAAVYVQNNKPSMTYLTERAVARLPDNIGLPDGTLASYIYINNTSDKTLSSYFLCKREITERDNGCITSVMVDKTSL